MYVLFLTVLLRCFFDTRQHSEEVDELHVGNTSRATYQYIIRETTRLERHHPVLPTAATTAGNTPYVNG